MEKCNKCQADMVAGADGAMVCSTCMLAECSCEATAEMGSEAPASEEVAA